MSTNTTYNIRIDKRIRQEADALYKSMGMSLSTAINLFLTQSVIQGKLPIVEVIAETAYSGKSEGVNSWVDDITGVIPNADVNEKKIKEERLALKYESLD